MNVCGIKSKLVNPDFDILIKQYDILILVETKTDEFDELKLPNDYTYFAKHSKKFTKKSGGIVIIIKKKLSKYLKFLKSDSEYVQWVEMSENVSSKASVDSKILFGCIYHLYTTRKF